MSRCFRPAAVLVLAALLAGCGAQAVATAPAEFARSSASASAMASLPAFPEGDAQAEKLLTAFKAIAGADEAAMAQRTQVVDQLAATDSDKAVTFLQNEEAHLEAYPQASQDAYEKHVLDALEALDTYAQTEDDATLKAGAGTTLESRTMYAQARTRQTRHRGMLYWAMHPFKAMGHAFSGFFHFLVGKPQRKRAPRNPGGGGNGGGGNGGYPNNGGGYGGNGGGYGNNNGGNGGYYGR